MFLPSAFAILVRVVMHKRMVYLILLDYLGMSQPEKNESMYFMEAGL